MPLQPADPRQVGTYRLEWRLGGGGMGQVYLGRSRGGRPVAVKVVRPELAEDPAFRERFALEVEAAGRVGGFYTAQVVDADPAAHPPWLVTAFVSGPSLAQAVHEHGPLAARTLDVLGAGLAEGLAAIHATGLVHRDLKPGNIILAADGPRVIDFGIVRAMDAAHGSTAVLGTPRFMSPEQARGLQVGPSSDVFALGSVLTFAATGRGPFGTGPPEAVLYRIVHQEPDLSGVPAHLIDLLRACLDKEPAERPRLADILERLADAPGTRSGQWLPREVTELISRYDSEYAHRPPDTTGGTPAPQAGRRWHLSRRSLVLAGLGIAAAVPAAPLLESLSAGAEGSLPREPAALFDGPVRALAFSPDGDLLQLWDATTHVKIATLAHTNSHLHALAFAPDGKTLAQLRNDGQITLWNIPSRRRTSAIGGPGSGITCIAFGPDGVLAGGLNDGTVTLWDISTGRSITALSAGANAEIECVAISPDGRTVAAAGGEGITVWTVR
ncbi:WD40 repeat domain-containing serine/threonine protein kinase [Actinomadura sp. 21ATH]|uniref:WD40 repeat domain-containing serine/threonine protein kinase n=1 Tax=Actinomadura sp. 21ATH TaxID=1735444 RepID=UPI0035BF0260